VWKGTEHSQYAVACEQLFSMSEITSAKKYTIAMKIKIACAPSVMYSAAASKQSNDVRTFQVSGGGGSDGVAIE